MSTDKSLEQQLKDATVVWIFKHSEDPNEGATILFSNGMRIRLGHVEGDALLPMIFTDQNGEKFHLSAKAYNEVLRRISPEELVKQKKEQRTVMHLVEGDQPYGDPSGYVHRTVNQTSDITFKDGEVVRDKDGEPTFELVQCDCDLLGTPDERLIGCDNQPLEGEYVFRCGSWGYRPDISPSDSRDLSFEERTAEWLWCSKPVTNPTCGDLTEKFNAYLAATGDFHAMFDGFSVDGNVIHVISGS